MNTLLQLLRKNLTVLLNAGSIVGTTAVTSLLGFAYWWVAARLFTTDALGLASALISVMSLLGTMSMLGLGTLLTGELTRQPGHEWALINTALIVTGGTGTGLGALFALLAPVLAPGLAAIGSNVFAIGFFALGTGLTALTMVLDQALIGILRGGLQLGRNTLFSAVKLLALIASFYCLPGTGLLIYITWLIGNLVSLSVLVVQKKRKTPAGTSASSRLYGGPAQALNSTTCDQTLLSASAASDTPRPGSNRQDTLPFHSTRAQERTRSDARAQPMLAAPAPATHVLLLDRDEEVERSLLNILNSRVLASDEEDMPESVLPPVPATQKEVPIARLASLESHHKPQWRLLRKLSSVAIQHHIVNLILMAPTQLLPILVAVMLSDAATAYFYVSFMLANFVFSLTYSLTTVLHAVSSAQPSILAQKIRFTFSLSCLASLGANLVLQVGAGLLLSTFGHTYADQAAWCLRLLALAVFPIIVKSHYLAICRVYDRSRHIILPIALGCSAELGLAAIGAQWYGLPGLSLGWLAALFFEAYFMTPTVYLAAYPLPNVSLFEQKPLRI